MTPALRSISKWSGARSAASSGSSRTKASKAIALPRSNSAPTTGTGPIPTTSNGCPPSPKNDASMMSPTSAPSSSASCGWRRISSAASGARPSSASNRMAPGSTANAIVLLGTAASPSRSGGTNTAIEPARSTSGHVDSSSTTPAASQRATLRRELEIDRVIPRPAGVGRRRAQAVGRGGVDEDSRDGCDTDHSSRDHREERDTSSRRFETESNAEIDRRTRWKSGEDPSYERRPSRTTRGVSGRSAPRRPRSSARRIPPRGRRRRPRARRRRCAIAARCAARCRSV